MNTTFQTLSLRKDLNLLSARPTSFSGLLLLVVMTVSLRGWAAPLSIKILDMQHSTEISMDRWMKTGFKTSVVTNYYSSSLTSFEPTTQSLLNPRTGLLAAEVSSDFFEIGSFTPSAMGRDPDIVVTKAIATSELWFTPVSSQTANLSMLISVGGHMWDSSRWSFSLLNVTTGTELWGYQFRGWGLDPMIFGVRYSDFSSASILLEADFLATDVYKITLYAKTFTGNEPQSPNISLQLSGLEAVSVVPEPSVLSLFLFGAMALVCRRGAHFIVGGASNL